MGEGAVVHVRGQNEGFVPGFHAPPKELEKTALPPYIVEPPDVLLIDAVKLVPKSPYKIEPLDVLQVFVENTLLDQPIAGLYAVDPGGMLNLGPAYGSVKVTGLSVEEAQAAVEKHLRVPLRQPRVSLSLAQTAGQQQIVGEHLVGPDGTVNLGMYGTVFVLGMTINEAREAIQKHLSSFLEDPKISVDVFAYNSKVYYVVMEGAGQGDRLFRFPVTGNETVLDAMSQVGGMAAMSSKNIWIARPAPPGSECKQILPVNWREVTRAGSSQTNYQILPGDRVFIAEDRLVALDTTVNKMTAPFERVFGFLLLSAQSLQTMQRFPKGLFGIDN
jgi:polysaccharide export outer membrane protein